MALTFRSLGRALTGGRPLTLKNIAKSAAPLALNAVIPGGGLVAKGLTLATKASKATSIAQSLFGAVKKPPIITTPPPQGLTALPMVNQAGMGGGLVGGLVGAGVSAVSAAAMQAAMQRLQQPSGGAAPSMTLVPAGTGSLSGGSASTGIYDRLDQALGGWLPGGTYAPGGVLNPMGLTGGTGGTGAGAGVLSGQVPITTQPATVQRLQAPPGYVLVRAPNGAVVAMLKVVAYALGLRKRPTRGGGLTRREVQSARKVQSFLMNLTSARRPKLPLKKGARR